MERAELERYAALDASGFLPGVGEEPVDFESRIAAIRAAHEEFGEELAEKGEVVVFDEFRLRESERIPADIIAEAGEVTGGLYDFRTAHVPGFFISRDVGLLWGGCMISDTELPFSFFLIRGAFRNRQRWFLYNRRELLAHEALPFDAAAVAGCAAGGVFRLPDESEPVPALSRQLLYPRL